MIKAILTNRTTGEEVEGNINPVIKFIERCTTEKDKLQVFIQRENDPFPLKGAIGSREQVLDFLKRKQAKVV